MEITWIEDFIALHELGSFTAAARRQATTQSAFSRRIQQLEDWLGAPLFVRTSRPVMLTAAGRDFAHRAMQLRNDMIDARRAAAVRRSHYAQTTARIYTTSTLAATHVLPDWLAAHHWNQYAIVTASVAACLEAARQHRADVALLPWFDPDLPTDLEGTRVSRDKLSLTMRQDSDKTLRLNKGRLTGPLLAYVPGTLFGSRVESLLETRGIRTDAPICESVAAEALLALVQAGLGAAWLPRSLCAGHPDLVHIHPALDVAYDIVQLAAPLAQPD